MRWLGPVTLAFALLLVAACGATPPTAAPRVAAPPQGVGTRLNGAMPASIEDLPLVDSTGRVRHLSDFHGRVLVVQDTMTLCQETCPIDTATLVRTAQDVDHAGESKKVAFLTLTVDPRRDSVAQLAAYRKLYGGPSNWYALTGSASQVDRLWDFLGVYRKRVAADAPPPRNWRTGKVLTYDVEHSDEVFFFDPRGRERFVLEGMPDAEGRTGIPARIYHFLSAEGRKNLQPGAGDWTTRQALQVTGWLLDHQIPA